MKIHVRIRYAAVLLGLFLFSPLTLAQTCLEGPGVTASDSTTSGHSAVGSSFTANCGGGPITAITIYYDTSNLGAVDRQLNIYDGPDFNSPVLHTLVIPYTSIVDGPNTFQISPPVPIDPAEVNSFEITAVGGGTAAEIANGVRWGGNVYAGGEPFWSRSLDWSTLDVAFEVELDGDAEVDDNAYFRVTKIFADGSTGDVDVTLTCNGGLPLTQSFTISGGGPGVTFVLKDFQTGATDCTVAESGVPEGYTASLNGGNGCTFENISAGLHQCQIVNTPEAAEYTVNMIWDVSPTASISPSTGTQVTVDCQSTIMTVNGVVVSPSNQFVGYLDDGDSVVLGVDVSAGPSSCSATQSISQPGAEPEASTDCTDGTLTAGGSATCTFTNTLFFEGIPSLDRYGLAIMMLLLLGAGYFGIRRFS